MDLSKYKGYVTVGDLLKFIEKHNIPMDGKILFQRIEDTYFENHNWTTINKEGYNYNQGLQWNKDIDSGKYHNTEEYPLMKLEDLKKIPEENLELAKDKYIVAHAPIKYPDDNNLYINAHY